MTDAPLLSVVIATWNGRALLEDCLPPLQAALARVGPSETIVVDNASSDGTAAWLQEAWPAVRVLALDENRGYAGASNAGARAANGDVVVFLNNDTEVEPEWASALLEAFEDDGVVMAGGLTLFLDQPGVVNTAGIRLLPTGGGTDIGFGLPVSALPPGPRDVPGVSGVSLAVRRGWFLDSGAYDERLFMYFEDVDLCWRALLEGWRIRYVPGSVVHHRFGATAGALYAPLRAFYASRNRLLVGFRNFDGPARVTAPLLSISMDAAIVATLLAGGQLDQARRTGWAMLRGTVAGLATAPPMLADRRRLASRRRRGVADVRAAGQLERLLPAVRELRRIAGTLRR